MIDGSGTVEDREESFSLRFHKIRFAVRRYRGRQRRRYWPSWVDS